MLICEMAAYYRSIGSSIKQRLEELYQQYGRYLNKVDSFEFPGLTGMDKMASIMQGLRNDPPQELAGLKVVKVTDYLKPEQTGLPAANVLIYTLEGGATVVVRPSGTEPKIKTYFTTLGKDLAEAQAQKDPPQELAGLKVVKVTDYLKPEQTGLPAANVLIYTLEGGATVVVRPSGTEPKIKTYFTTLGKDLAEAQAQKDALAAAIAPILE